MHAEAHIANVLGFAPGADAIDPRLRSQVHRELSRTPEIETPLRDLWGNWDFPYGDSNLEGQLYEPWLDRLVLAERDRLAAASPGSAPEPMWPGGKSFAVCLTHDMDFITLHPSMSGSARMLARNLGLLTRRPRDRAHVSDMVRNTVRATYLLATLRGLRPSRERTYDEWLALEDRHGFKSTFFYFPDAVSVPHVYDCQYSYDDPARFGGRRMRVRDMMVEMDRAGWEVGLHGSYHSAVQPGMLGMQKRRVEAAVGRPVLSTRQHWLRYDVRTTPKLQAEAGLLADSTQGFNRNVGFRAGTSFPYMTWDFAGDAALPVLEVPQHVMDGALFTPNALEYDVEHAVRHCVHLMGKVQAVGGCLTLSWHPNSLQYPHYWATYEAVLAEAARRGAWGCTMGELHRWWTERTARIAARGPAAGAR